MSHQSLCPRDLSNWSRTMILPRWSPRFSWELIQLGEDALQVCGQDSPAGTPHGSWRLPPGGAWPTGDPDFEAA